MSLYIGVMSGTSLDGIDVSITDFSDDQIQLVAAETYPFSEQLRRDLHQLIATARTHLHQLGQIDVALGHAYSEAINQLLDETQISANQIVAIGCHGQTVFHAPDCRYPFSMQIGNANVIAEKTGITTITDFRQRDMVLGGQGAPLVPAFHQALFHSHNENRVIANIGGIGNITILPKDKKNVVSGFDTGPGNVLMDEWYQQHHLDLYDANGDWARDGTVDKELLDILMMDNFFGQAIPKSTGREYFNLKWLANILTQVDKAIPAKDIQKTLLEMTARSITDAITTYAEDTDAVYVCGGGSHNEVLMNALRKHLPGISVETTSKLGLAPDWVEACAFSWLAMRTLAHQAGNLPAVTGADKPSILGAIYPSNINS